ncbi:MAG: EamA family transporter [Parvularculaceae bacterium]|nr:EamA family transporter [Parvularculaceae bacterium]
MSARTPSARDWALFAAQVAIGGSSFAFIHVALETLPPAVVTVGRMWVGAIVMGAVMLFAGRRPPPLLVRTKSGLALHRAWGWMLAVGAVGYAIPFLIFPWAQQYIASGLAGVYMAFMPLWTLALAYLFAGETLTRAKLAGFALGFVGVLILLGPEIIAGVAHSGVFAQGALLVATFFYAASAVISRRAPRLRPQVFSAGTTLAGAVMTTPALLFSPLAPADWSLASLVAVVVLGVAPTGLAGFVIYILIKRVGAGFMSLSNYLTPVFAVFLGALLFHERLDWTVFAALAVILSGVFLSQRSVFRRRPSNLDDAARHADRRPADADA